MINVTFQTAASHLARRDMQRVSQRCQHYGGSHGTQHKEPLREAPLPMTEDPWEVSFNAAAMADERLSQTASIAAGLREVAELKTLLADLATVGDFLEAPLASSVLARLTLAKEVP